LDILILKILFFKEDNIKLELSAEDLDLESGQDILKEVSIKMGM